MKQATFDPIMFDRHPFVMVVVGLTQSGKTTYMNLCQANWRARGGNVLAIDGVQSEPPRPKHLAAWASCRAEKPPAAIPKQVSLVTCDESSLYLGASRAQYPVLRECIFRGQHTGHYGTSCIFATQRAKMIHLDAWSQAQRVVVFRTNDQRDLDRIGELPGMTPEVIAMIPQLPTGYAVVWDMRDGVWIPWIPAWHGR